MNTDLMIEIRDTLDNNYQKLLELLSKTTQEERHYVDQQINIYNHKLYNIRQAHVGSVYTHTTVHIAYELTYLVIANGTLLPAIPEYLLQDSLYDGLHVNRLTQDDVTVGYLLQDKYHVQLEDDPSHIVTKPTHINCIQQYEGCMHFTNVIIHPENT